MDKKRRKIVDYTISKASSDSDKLVIDVILDDGDILHIDSNTPTGDKLTRREMVQLAELLVRSKDDI